MLLSFTFIVKQFLNYLIKIVTYDTKNIHRNFNLINIHMTNKYKKWYDDIIKRAQIRVIVGYSETHHILPRSLGGSDDPTNLVKLTAREHFICHVLLTKLNTGHNKNKMIRAVMFMKSANSKQQRYINSRLYSKARVEFSQQQSHQMQGKNNNFYGKTHSLQSREKMSQTKKGK